MRNQILKLMAAGVLLLALAVAGSSWLRRVEPQAPPVSESNREQAQRAQQIVNEVQQGRVGHARALADSFYRAYPNSPEIQNLEGLTGYHPRPYGP
jgi:hypothetical protein